MGYNIKFQYIFLKIDFDQFSKREHTLTATASNPEKSIPLRKKLIDQLPP